MDWDEVPPETVGMDSAGVQAVVDWVQRRRGAGLRGAQLVVLRRGKVVLDRVFGVARRREQVPVSPQTEFILYSTSKPYIAILTHLLAERGSLALDDPVARYWPEFARHGKRGITIRHVLQHRAGIPIDYSPASIWDMPDWDRSIRRIEAMRPRYPPGLVPAYHMLTFGFVLGEVVRRVTGVSPDRFLQTALLDPLGLADTYLCLPAGCWQQRAEVYATNGLGEAGSAFLFNRRRYRQAVIPAASVSSTARDVALFYEMLRCGGELNGRRVLRPETVAEARRPSSDNERDRATGWDSRWSHGFLLGGSITDDSLGLVFGRRSSKETFGHSGSQCCNAWADPTRDLVFAYLTGHLLPGREGVELQGELSDLVLAACS